MLMNIRSVCSSWDTVDLLDWKMNPLCFLVDERDMALHLNGNVFGAMPWRTSTS
jgi:hypothetical protein